VNKHAVIATSAAVLLGFAAVLSLSVLEWKSGNLRSELLRGVSIRRFGLQRRAAYHQSPARPDPLVAMPRRNSKRMLKRRSWFAGSVAPRSLLLGEVNWCPRAGSAHDPQRMSVT
jgi:hypothetical protein